MASRKTRKTKSKVSSLKPKSLSADQTKRVKGGGWNVKQNTKV